jgi:hypothetical protein
VDPVTPNADFGRLMQYGAIGIVAMGLLTLVVAIFRQLINGLIEQNKKLTEQSHEMQAKTLESLHAIGQAIRDMDNTLRHFKVDVSRDVASMVRDEATSAGSRAHRLKPPR